MIRQEIVVAPDAHDPEPAPLINNAANAVPSVVAQIIHENKWGFILPDNMAEI